MRRLFIVLAAAVLGAAVSGCHAKASLTLLQAQGKQVFDVGCAHCHVSNDLHMQPAPPDLRGLFSHPTLPGGEPATDASVQHLLMTGKGRMPSFAYQMTPRQMAAVIAYLKVYGTGAKAD